MRRMRPELTAIVRQVRTAVLWAFACSAGAAVCALALPIVVVHALAAGAGTTPQMLVPVMAVALSALLLAGAFLTARARLLSRAELWARHALGADVLAHGLDAIRTPNEIDGDRERIARMTSFLPRLGPLFDGGLLVLPLGLLLLLQPYMGVVTVATLAIGAGIAAVLTRHVARFAGESEAARAAADGAWRTAAASSIVIASRGMTGRVTGEWQALHGRSVSREYRVALARERADAVWRHVQAAAILAVIATGVLLGSGSGVIGTVAAGLLLHTAITQTATTAFATLAEALPALRDFRTVTDGRAQSGFTADERVRDSQTPTQAGAVRANPLAEAS